MKTKLKINTTSFLCLAFLILFSGNNLFAGKNIYEQTEELITEHYGSKINFKQVEFTVSKELKKKINKFSYSKYISDELLIWVISQKDSLIAFAVIDQAFGKKKYFTYIAFISQNGDVEKVKIIKYLESKGRGVTKKNWLDQFTGKKKDSYLHLDKEISALTGATLSSRSLTNGIKKILFLFPYIKESLISI